MTLKKIMLEFVELGENYRATNNKQVKDYYNNYVEIIIENEIGLEHREKMYSYWKGLKGEENK